MRQIIACVLCALALAACAEPTTQPGELDSGCCGGLTAYDCATWYPNGC